MKQLDLNKRERPLPNGLINHYARRSYGGRNDYSSMAEVARLTKKIPDGLAKTVSIQMDMLE